MKRLKPKVVASLLVLYIFTLALSLDISTGDTASITVNEAIGRGSIWEDPCTIDGFMMGIGSVTQNWSTVLVGLTRAVYVDKCDFWPFW